MRARFIALAIAVCGIFVLAIPQPTVSVEPQETAAQIDFDALHAQATAALAALQQSGQIQAALQAAVEF
jgi:hypothetical protein